MATTLVDRTTSVSSILKKRPKLELLLQIARGLRWRMVFRYHNQLNAYIRWRNVRP